MAGVKGRSGTNKNQDKLWTDALRIAVNEPDDKGIKKLRRIAEKVVESAIAGDMQAAKEIGDRLDGKPAQAIEHAGKDGGPLHSVIEMVIVEAKG